MKCIWNFTQAKRVLFRISCQNFRSKYTTNPYFIIFIIKLIQVREWFWNLAQRTELEFQRCPKSFKLFWQRYVKIMTSKIMLSFFGTPGITCEGNVWMCIITCYELAKSCCFVKTWLMTMVWSINELSRIIEYYFLQKPFIKLFCVLTKSCYDLKLFV